MLFVSFENNGFNIIDKLINNKIEKEWIIENKIYGEKVNNFINIKIDNKTFDSLDFKEEKYLIFYIKKDEKTPICFSEKDYLYTYAFRLNYNSPFIYCNNTIF